MSDTTFTPGRAICANCHQQGVLLGETWWHHPPSGAGATPRWYRHCEPETTEPAVRSVIGGITG